MSLKFQTLVWRNVRRTAPPPSSFFIADSLFGGKKKKKKAAWEIDNTLILEISLSLEFS